jgi:hypothetical protein
MKQYRKLIVAGILAVALAGGAGAAMATDGGGHGGAGKAKQTESYRVAHKKGDGPVEKGLSSVMSDDGKPGLHQEGTPPNHGGKPDTHSYRAR